MLQLLLLFCRCYSTCCCICFFCLVGGKRKQQELEATRVYETARAIAHPPSAQIMRPIPALSVSTDDTYDSVLQKSGQYSPPKLGSEKAGLSPTQLARKLVFL